MALQLESQLASQEADLRLGPDRLGHATFLSEGTKEEVVRRQIPVEICVRSFETFAQFVGKDALTPASS